ncbi:MAG: hypothetical protein O9341_18070 [Paucibacter sp.]|nr:hypothetical protein [Roseateles sp.]
MNARLNWIAPARGAGVPKAAAAKRCECTTACGDDERVIKGLVPACALHAKAQALRVTLANTTATLEGLRTSTEALHAAAQHMVGVLDRMEPDVPEAERATDEDWIAGKARLVQALAGHQASGLPAKGKEGAAAP